MLYVLYIIVACTVHDPILMCVHYYMVRVCVFDMRSVCETGCYIYILIPQQFCHNANGSGDGGDDGGPVIDG